MKEQGQIIGNNFKTGMTNRKQVALYTSFSKSEKMEADGFINYLR